MIIMFMNLILGQKVYDKTEKTLENILGYD